jgi:protein pelota
VYELWLLMHLVEAYLFADYLQESARACYGPKHVEFALQQFAIQTLLITDTLFR